MSPKRPTSVEVIEAWERDGHIDAWASFDGHVLFFMHHRLAVRDRKLAYGLARRVVELDHRGTPTKESIEHIDPDADRTAHALIYAEHLDRFEFHDHDWRTQQAPDRISQLPKHLREEAIERDGLVERRDLLTTHRVPKSAPATFATPHTRLIHRNAAGDVVRTLDIKGAYHADAD